MIPSMMTRMLTVMKIDLTMGRGVEIERGRSRCATLRALVLVLELVLVVLHTT